MKIAIILVVVVVVITGFFVWQRLHIASILATVVPVPDNDPEMIVAVKKAQSTLDDFRKELQATTTAQRYLLIKARFVEGAVSEHMWVADLVVDGDAFRGVLADEPEFIKNMQFKQAVTITRQQITDWMIVQDGHVKGAFTTRLLRSRLTEKQRKVFENNLPYKLD